MNNGIDNKYVISNILMLSSSDICAGTYPTIANFEEKLLEKDCKPRSQIKVLYSSEFTPLSIRTLAKI
jgi:hypothetical protein